MRSKRLVLLAITDCTPRPGQLSGNMRLWSQCGPCVGGRVCLDPCKSITTNGKSTVSSHPAGGRFSCAIFTVRGQWMAVREHHVSVKTGIELDIVGNSTEWSE